MSGRERGSFGMQVRQLLEMIRFSHTLFALPFALLAAVMAWRVADVDGRMIPFQFRQLLGILICMVGARSAAMAFNRIVDRRLDAANPRTRQRHLPAGILSLGTVVAFALLAALVFVAGTLLFLPNPWPLRLALPVLAWLCGYSYAKRFTALAHFWLGSALMLAPLCTWIAIRGDLVLVHPADAWPPLLIGTAVFLWVAGFDIIYACQDMEFDLQARLRSIPVQLGIRRSLRLAAACHLLMIGALAALPFVARWGGPPVELGWIYGTGILAVAVLLFVEHALVRPDDLTRVNVAFFHVNAAISLGLLALVSLDLFL